MRENEKIQEGGGGGGGTRCLDPTILHSWYKKSVTG